MKSRLRNLIVFLILMFGSAAAFAIKSSSLIYRLSEHITLAVEIVETESGDSISFYLNDTRPDGVKNWRFDHAQFFKRDMIQKLKFPKPDVIGGDPDPVISFEENGDLARNLKKGGNFVYDMTVRSYTGEWAPETTIYPIKEMIRDQEMHRHTLREWPGVEDSARYIAVREVKGNPAALISIAHVKKDGTYVHQYLLGDTDSGYHVIEGSYMDLYSMPDRWEKDLHVNSSSKPQLYLGGSLLLESPYEMMLARHYPGLLVEGNGKFPGFTYPLNPLGTQNLIPGLDKVPSHPPAGTEIGLDGEEEIVKLKPGWFRAPPKAPVLSEGAREERAKTAADDLLERMKAGVGAAPSAPRDDGSKKQFNDMMARFGVRGLLCIRAQRR